MNIHDSPSPILHGSHEPPCSPQPKSTELGDGAHFNCCRTNSIWLGGTSSNTIRLTEILADFLIPLPVSQSVLALQQHHVNLRLVFGFCPTFLARARHSVHNVLVAHQPSPHQIALCCMEIASTFTNKVSRLNPAVLDVMSTSNGVRCKIIDDRSSTRVEPQKSVVCDTWHPENGGTLLQGARGCRRL